MLPAGRDRKRVVRRRLRPDAVRIDRAVPPPTRYSLIPSLKNERTSPRWLTPFARHRSGFVSLSTNNSSAPLSQRRTYLPSVLLEASSAVPLIAATCDDGPFAGRRAARCSGTTASAGDAASPASGPRLNAEISIKTSSGSAFAYSTNTSKYRSSSNTPVSISSYSVSVRERRRWSRPGHRTETAPAGTCTGTACTSVSACCRDRSSTPSRPHRGCPHGW